MARNRAKYDETQAQSSIFDDEELFTEDIKKDEIAVMVGPTKKSFEETDKIPCVSIVIGGLHMIGAKSNEVYHWTGIGESIDVEYRDLMAEVRKHSWYVYEPAFIINDDDFLAEHEDITNRYGQLYTPSDIEQVLALPAPQLEEQLKKMPVGAQNAVRDLAVRKIDNGELDSVQRLKVLDNFFGTELVLKLTK